MPVHLPTLLVLAAAAFAQPRPQDAMRSLVRAFDDHFVVIAGEALWLGLIGRSASSVLAIHLISRSAT
jgi:hypothetical protein